MVTYVKGNFFESPAQVLTNTVNCVGVMGMGVALEFKNRYPNLFNDYKNRCGQGGVKPGIPYLWEDDRVQILNFPTKRHWRDSSLLQDIEDGLNYLSHNYDKMGIQSLAMPALGCGNGGLDWSDVSPIIDRYLGPIPDLDVYVYEPTSIALKKSKSDSAASKSSSQQRKVALHPLGMLAEK